MARKGPAIWHPLESECAYTSLAKERHCWSTLKHIGCIPHHKVVKLILNRPQTWSFQDNLWTFMGIGIGPSFMINGLHTQLTQIPGNKELNFPTSSNLRTSKIQHHPVEWWHPRTFKPGLDGLLLPGHKHCTDPTLSSEQPVFGNLTWTFVLFQENTSSVRIGSWKKSGPKIQWNVATTI